MGTYENPFEFDFDSYIREVEPCKQERGKNWATAIGLQKVDGLTPSKYLYETAKRNIEGEISIEEAKALCDSKGVDAYNITSREKRKEIYIHLISE